MHSSRVLRRWLALGVAVAFVAIVWLAVLPRLESQSRVRAHIEHLRDHQIDPAAMFYTDLEGMPRWEARIRAAQTRHPQD